MPPLMLTEDEFRVLAYIRAYADGPQQHLDPGWVQEQLAFTSEQMRTTGRSLAEKGLAKFFEYDPPADIRAQAPQLPPGPMMCDIHLTPRGWDLLRSGKAW